MPHETKEKKRTTVKKIVKKKKVIINVISKSGTTTETAVVFRILKQYMEKIYGKKGVINLRRIFQTIIITGILLLLPTIIFALFI